MKLPKLLIIGHARHGKDTVSEILQNTYGFKFESSSAFCAKKFIYNELKNKYNYASYQDCYLDRHNHREEWFNMIHEYCKNDLSRLGKEIFDEYDIYCGLRNKSEFHAMRNKEIFDFSIWVDRSQHLPLESTSSMNLEIWMADYVIDNNNDLDMLKTHTVELAQSLISKKNNCFRDQVEFRPYAN